MYSTLIRGLVEGVALSAEQAEAVMNEVMAGALEPEQIAAFLTALACRGETVDELLGLLMAMRGGMVRLPTGVEAVDTCGTGGTGMAKPNTSTLSAFVVSAAGVPVAKHGNRSSTGRCGSADVLEFLGVPIDLQPERAAELLESAGFCFMLAPQFHPGMAHAGPVRKKLGFRTAFNLLGPLANPAGVKRQLVGVGDAAHGPKLAEVLRRAGARSAWVVHGSDGLDEMTVTGPSRCWQVDAAGVHAVTIAPEDVGVRTFRADALEFPVDVEGSAAVFEAVLRDEPGPALEMVVLNAAASLVSAAAFTDLGSAVEAAREIIASGKALEAFETYRDAAAATRP